MWDRGILKSNAKVALRGRYWIAFAASLLTVVLQEGYSFMRQPFGLWFSQLHNFPNIDYWTLITYRSPLDFLKFMDLAFSIFIVNIILIGLSRFFLQNHFGVTQFETLFSGFRQNYMNSVGAMFITDLFIGLWYLLLIIPGIIKTIEYSMVRFILADNPAMPGSRAREISRIMTNGEKGSIFVLYLSFLGWYLLGTICFGVGIFFVNPYYQATMAELYIFLRDRAIQTNQVNPAELGLIAPAPYVDPTNMPIL